MKRTMKVHIRGDGTEYIIRFVGGRQHWDRDRSSPNLSEAAHLIRTQGGSVQVRPTPRKRRWDDSMLHLIRHYLHHQTPPGTR